MVAGPDGALWYANFTGNSIGRITHQRPREVGLPRSQHQAPGRDRGRAGWALWFTNSAGNSINAVPSGSIGRITTTGQVTTYPAPGAHSPFSIIAGPDGAMWFTMGNGHIGRITTP
jgi:virginiamycin B lyase